MTREAITFTTVTDFDNSFSHRFSHGQRPVYQFEATLGPLTRAEVESISAFHIFHRGNKPFLWNGGAWGTVENYNLIAEGDGVERKFYLPNRYIGASSIAIRTLRESTGISSTWLVSSSNSWPYSLGASPGIITFANSSNTIPVSGDDVFAKYGCQYLCVFDSEGLRIEQVARNVWNVDLKVKESLDDVTIPAAPFVPTDISGLSLWLKADGTLWQNIARTTPVTADGDPVGAWDDESGGSYHALAAVGTTDRPTYKTVIVNGLPVLRFDASQDQLVTPSISVGMNDATTVFLVAKVTTKTAFGMFLCYGINGTGAWNMRQVDSSGRLSLVNGETNIGAGATAPFTPDGTTADLEGQGFKILEGSITAGNAWEIWENGVSKDTATETFTLAASNVFYLGARNGGFLLNGDIAEVLVYSGALSTANRQSVENYLNQKYQIY